MMKFRKNQNKEKQIPKEKKPRVYKVNPHKKVVIALWVLLGLSFSFAIFKHFTAIDTHTIHETTIIEYSSCRKFCRELCESLLFMGAIR